MISSGEDPQAAALETGSSSGSVSDHEGHELEHSEQLVRALLNATGQGIYGVDLDGNCTFANPACVELLGYEHESDLLNRNMHALIHHTRPNGDPYPSDECQIYAAIREERGIHIGDEIVWRADGESYPVEYWSYPVHHDGKLLGCVVAFVDISERLDAENDLREREATVRALLNATGEGIYGTNLDGDFTFANPACVKLLGYESDKELLGRNVHKLIHHTRPTGEPYPIEECHIYQAFREGCDINLRDEIVWRADRTSFPVEYWSSPVQVNDKVAGCVVAFFDTTERKRAEEDLRQSEKLAALGKLSAGLAHELNNPAAAAQRAAAQLRERLERLAGFALELGELGLSGQQWQSLRNTVDRTRGEAPPTLSALDRADREEAIANWLSSHDLADAWQLAPPLVAAGVDESSLETMTTYLPASAIAAAVAWLSESLATDELLETLTTTTGSISELVAAVKGYSYMDQAPQQEVDIHEGLEGTLRMLQHKLKTGVTVHREYDAELPRIPVLAGELNQVWTNLLDNAIDAAGPTGEIGVRTWADGDHIVVEVRDNGPGIPDEIRLRIFDPFFTTKDVGEGTGLGLDVVRRIITGRSGGEIDVSSEPGDTRFVVRLPRAGPPTEGERLEG
jgi:PAS domain S-box-containing protein